MDVATTDPRRLPTSHATVAGNAFASAKVSKWTWFAADLKPAGRDVAQDLFDNSTVQSLSIFDGSIAGPKAQPPVRAWRVRNGAMRISTRFLSMAVAGLALASEPSFALDGTSPGMPSAALTDPSIPVPPMPIGVPSAIAPSTVGPNVTGPNGLPKSVAPAVAPSSLTALQYAAEGGHPIAQWKLGRMYANGDGVARDDMRAFDYFSRIANSHAEDSPAAPQAQVVANAFLALGRYYREGIPNSRVKPDRERAREMFAYAASYFGNPDAQYNLARMYLDGTQRDAKYAARWLGLAAQKGQLQAQVLLGQMLFNGDQLQRQAARGLMWLTLAKDNAGPDEDWVISAYESAAKRASEDDRAIAGRMAERWAQGRRD